VGQGTAFVGSLFRYFCKNVYAAFVGREPIP